MAYAELSLFIAGKRLRGSGPPLEVHDPATGEKIGEFMGASSNDMESAVLAASDAFSIWGVAPAIERESRLRAAADRIRERAAEISAVITAENGKPLLEARGEVGATADTLDFFAGEARRQYGRTIPARTEGARMFTFKEPLGVVAAFTPWNFPAINFIRKIAPALAAGCTVVAKPAEETPATALILAECLRDAGIPAGCLNLLYGVPAEISTYLIESPVVRKISFTGSTFVGRTLATKAAEHLKRSTFELGGHAPVIVCADTDPEVAADKAAAAKFRNAGQTCNSASRFYVHASIYERFWRRMVHNAQNVVVGPGLDPSTTMGPLSNPRRITALTQLVEDSVQKGARVVSGGLEIKRPGNFFQPTVLADVPPQARIMNEEPFGPVAPVVSFDTLEQALELANSTPFGLASYVVSDHAPSIAMLTKRLGAGVVGVNTFVASLPETPFGGIGASGWGSEGGPEGIEPYLQTKFIHQT